MANIKISDLPSATTPLSGTEEVPIVQNGETVKVATNQIGGTPAIPTLQQVLNSGNIANANETGQIKLDDNDDNLHSTLNPGQIFLEEGLNSSNLTPIALEFADINVIASINTEGLLFIEKPTFAIQNLYPSPAFANQKVYLPSYDGNLAVTQAQSQATINSTPYTINGDNQNLYLVVTGASNIILNPANWIDRITVILLVDITGTSFTTTGGATIRGAVGGSYGISVGMVSVMYFQSNNTFYISRP